MKKRKPARQVKKAVAKEQKGHPTAMEFVMALIIMLALLAMGKTAVTLMGW